MISGNENSGSSFFEGSSVFGLGGGGGRRLTKREFLAMEIVPCSFFETFKRMEITCDTEVTAEDAKKQSQENEDEIQITLGGGGGVAFGQQNMVFPVLEHEQQVPPGKLQLDPRDFVDFDNEMDNHFVSIACGLSQPFQMIDACVGNSQPGLLVDTCVGSSQPLVEMQDESVETTRIEVKDHETMTNSSSRDVIMKRSGAFYPEEVASKKVRRTILGELELSANSNTSMVCDKKEVDYALKNYGKRTLLYPSQMNHDFNEEEDEPPMPTVGLRVPVLRVGLSKKVRPPRLLTQYRAVPQPCQMDEDDYDDENKEN